MQIPAVVFRYLEKETPGLVSFTSRHFFEQGGGEDGVFRREVQAVHLAGGEPDSIGQMRTLYPFHSA